MDDATSSRPGMVETWLLFFNPLVTDRREVIEIHRPFSPLDAR